MIRISQIDDELSIYKNNTVVLLGLGNGFKRMFDLLQYHDIEVNCICDNNKDNWGTTRHGLKVISPPELKKMIESEDSNIVVQVAIKDMDEVTIDLLSNMGAEAVISFDEVVEFSSSLRKKHGSNIRISQIDDEMSIYMNNTVVLLGLGNGVEAILDLLNYHNIKANCICDSNKENWGEIRHGYPVISPKHLELMADNDNIVVQVVSKNIDNKFIKEMSKLKIISVISYTESKDVLKFLLRLKIIRENKQVGVALQKAFKENLSIRPCEKSIKNSYELIFDNINSPQLNFICLPTKTGDHTLLNTFKHHNINILMTWHTPENIDINLLNSIGKNVKIITAVRDPMSINLSILFQCISASYNMRHTAMLSLIDKNVFEKGGDVQYLFDNWFNDIDKINPIYDFMNRLKENVIDLSKYHFDKEKGYSIIKEGNIEVFVYQLEKMNNIAKEMSDWIGQTSFDEWDMGNVSEEKWIANSYKQAQIDITFSKEYFDKCYNDPWVKHFYSDEDIGKFKDRWRPHIKD